MPASARGQALALEAQRLAQSLTTHRWQGENLTHVFCPKACDLPSLHAVSVSLGSGRRGIPLPVVFEGSHLPLG